MRWLTLLALAACHHSTPSAYLKGQLHVHTSNSGDSKTSPERVASWYAEHGFDFIVLTDHNHISTLADGNLLVIPGVELTQNLETCDPPRGTTCNLHVNALFLTDTRPLAWTPGGHATRLDLYESALEETRRRGGIAQLDHPNFHWGADAALITELVKRGLVLFEVANESSDVANDGDAASGSSSMFVARPARDRSRLGWEGHCRWTAQACSLSVRRWRSARWRKGAACQCGRCRSGRVVAPSWLLVVQGRPADAVSLDR